MKPIKSLILLVGGALFSTLAVATPTAKQIAVSKVPEKAKSFIRSEVGFSLKDEKNGGGAYFDNFGKYEVSCSIKKYKGKANIQNTLFVKTTNKYIEIGDSDQQKIKPTDGNMDPSEFDYGYFHFEKDSKIETLIRNSCAGKNKITINTKFYNWVSEDSFSSQKYYLYFAEIK